MRCPNCNSRNSTNARVCTECGRALEVICSACRARCPIGFRFCGQCGHELSSVSTGRPELVPKLPGEQVRGGRERRQLTVLFCDLVDSTLMSSRLDAEDFGDLIGEYFQRCKAAFERFGGFVDREEGDSLRVYFGYPQARDDDAPRAVRAALEVIDCVRQLGVELDRPLEVHIGIHSGEVVAGEIAGPAGSPGPLVVGDVPNIAKRLEESAPRGTVYVGPSTFRLVESWFTWETVGPLTLKGIPAPVSAYRAVRYRGMSRTIDLFDARVLTPMQDRREELALLQKRWASARRGRSQVVLVSGEPGIGKSRLVHAFVTALAGQTCTVLATQCQEQYVDSAWFPFVDLLKRQLGFDAERSASDRAAELEAAFAAGRLPQPEALPLVASLLSLSVGPPLNLWPRLQRERTLDWLVHWILGGTSSKPLLLVIEDAHWADASTLDALALLMERLSSRRALVLITYRPEFTPPWPLRSHMSQLSLSRLSAEETCEMVMSLAGGETLPPGLLFPITTRSDGVPLFVEELTKMLLESVAKLERDDAASLTNGARAVTIPETLRGSLVARLDHLGPAKSTAQIAAVLGREFSYKLIQAVSRHADNALQGHLGQLIDAELLYQRGQPPAATYTFKHALVQEAAYLSLLKARRADYHERTARVLMQEFPDVAEAHPELVAKHCAEAGLVDEAVTHWHRAGQRALEASADVEAIAHLSNALERLAASPPAPGRIDGEVKCLITLGSALTAVRGYAAPEAEEAFARAHDLCETLGDQTQLYAALMGLYSVYQVRGRLDRAVELGHRLVRIAGETGDPLRRAQAHRCLGWSLFCSGSLQLGNDHLEIALGLFDRLRSQEHMRIHGAHPWVVGFVNSALLAWFAGRPDDAVERSERAIALAQELRHGQPLALAYALCMSAAVHCCRQDAEKTSMLARDVLALCAENALPYWSAWASTLLGWALTHTGRHEDGLAALRRGLDEYRATGALLFEPYSLALLAESCVVAGLADEAREAVELAFKSPMFSSDYFYSAELHRLRGRIIAETGGDMAEAETCTRLALDLAQSQGAVALAARAEEQLARLRAQGASEGGPVAVRAAPAA